MDYNRDSAGECGNWPAAQVLDALRAQCLEAWQAATVVGRWVWVQFDQKPCEEVRRCLLELGFHWNRRRECWQHSGGRRSAYSSGDPRERYGSVRAAELDAVA